MREHRTSAVVSRVVVLVVDIQLWCAGPPLAGMATLEPMRTDCRLVGDSARSPHLRRSPCIPTYLNAAYSFVTAACIPSRHFAAALTPHARDLPIRRALMYSDWKQRSASVAGAEGVSDTNAEGNRKLALREPLAQITTGIISGSVVSACTGPVAYNSILLRSEPDTVLWAVTGFGDERVSGHGQGGHAGTFDGTTKTTLSRLCLSPSKMC